jgi:hypothetical protein
LGSQNPSVSKNEMIHYENHQTKELNKNIMYAKKEILSMEKINSKVSHIVHDP